MSFPECPLQLKYATLRRSYVCEVREHSLRANGPIYSRLGVYDCVFMFVYVCLLRNVFMFIKDPKAVYKHSRVYKQCL